MKAVKSTIVHFLSAYYSKVRRCGPTRYGFFLSLCEQEKSFFSQIQTGDTSRFTEEG
jgi:hypothetical protein